MITGQVSTIVPAGIGQDANTPRPGRDVRSLCREDNIEYNLPFGVSSTRYNEVERTSGILASPVMIIRGS